MQQFRIVARQQLGSEKESAVNTEGSTVKEKNAIQFINFDAFKKALLRICILAHEKLGGQTSQ